MVITLHGRIPIKIAKVTNTNPFQTIYLDCFNHDENNHYDTFKSATVNRISTLLETNSMRLVLPFSQNVSQVLYKHKHIDQYGVTVFNGNECGKDININHNVHFLNAVTEKDKCIHSIEKYDANTLWR